MQRMRWFAHETRINLPMASGYLRQYISRAGQQVAVASKSHSGFDIGRALHSRMQSNSWAEGVGQHGGAVKELELILVLQLQSVKLQPWMLTHSHGWSCDSEVVRFL